MSAVLTQALKQMQQKVMHQVLVDAKTLNLGGEIAIHKAPRLYKRGCFLMEEASEEKQRMRRRLQWEIKEIKKKKQEVKIGDQLEESGENVFVGGKNRWKYSTFVNWELWWPKFPILVYFKETQTKPEGQVHFFPVIFNGKQLYDVMVERAGPSKTSGPK